MGLNKLGDLTLKSSTEENVCYQTEVYDDAVLDNDVLDEDIESDVDSAVDPDFFWNPDNAWVELNVAGTGNDGAQQVIAVQYQDNVDKEVPIATGYQVVVYIEYVEKHPELEKITDPLERIAAYERAISNTIY